MRIALQSYNEIDGIVTYFFRIWYILFPPTLTSLTKSVVVLNCLFKHVYRQTLTFIDLSKSPLLTLRVSKLQIAVLGCFSAVTHLLFAWKFHLSITGLNFIYLFLTLLFYSASHLMGLVTCLQPSKQLTHMKFFSLQFWAEFWWARLILVQEVGFLPYSLTAEKHDYLNSIFIIYR